MILFTNIQESYLCEGVGRLLTIDMYVTVPLGKTGGGGWGVGGDSYLTAQPSLICQGAYWLGSRGYGLWLKACHRENSLLFHSSQ